MKYFIKFKQNYTNYAYTPFNYLIQWVFPIEWIVFNNISFSKIYWKFWIKKYPSHWILTASLSRFKYTFSL